MVYFKAKVEYLLIDDGKDKIVKEVYVVKDTGICEVEAKLVDYITTEHPRVRDVEVRAVEQLNKIARVVRTKDTEDGSCVWYKVTVEISPMDDDAKPFKEDWLVKSKGIKGVVDVIIDYSKKNHNVETTRVNINPIKIADVLDSKINVVSLSNK